MFGRIRLVAAGVFVGSFTGGGIGAVTSLVQTLGARIAHRDDFYETHLGKGEFAGCKQNDYNPAPIGSQNTSYQTTLQKMSYSSVKSNEDDPDYPIICNPRNRTKEELIFTSAENYINQFPDSSVSYWLPNSILIGMGIGTALCLTSLMCCSTHPANQPIPELKEVLIENEVKSGGNQPNKKMLTFQERYDQTGFPFEDIPKDFLCPINLTLMDKPLILENGLCIDEATLNDPNFKRFNGKNPVTGKPISYPLSLPPNLYLMQSIESWLKEKELLSQQLKNQSVHSPEEKSVISFLTDREKLPKNRVNPKFLCSITKEVMENPVKASDGYYYEEKAILSQFERNDFISPVTGSTLTQVLTPDHALRKEIQSWLNFEKRLIANKQAAASSANQPSGSNESLLPESRLQLA